MNGETRQDNFTNRLRVCHIITSLEVGGTQAMLYKLLSALRDSDVESSVISLVGGGAMAERIRDLGIPVASLDLRPRSPVPRPDALLRLIQLIRGLKPDLLQTWLYHADLLGGLAGRWVNKTPIIWKCCTIKVDSRVDPWRTRLTARLCSLMSRRLPARILINTAAGKHEHAAMGYDADRMVVIPNGFDTDRFRPSPEARSRIRRELGLREEDLMIGVIGRFHPVKDYETFVEAARILSTRFENLHFVMCGEDLDVDNDTLSRWIASRNLNRRRFHLLGRRNDVADIHTSLDVMVLSSLMEGFPNVVGEAMACGTPCVVTDISDCRQLVGETGIVVPPQQSSAMANACEMLLRQTPEERQRLGQLARQRIAANYSLSTVTREYVRQWREVCAAKQTCRRDSAADDRAVTNRAA